MARGTDKPVPLEKRNLVLTGFMGSGKTVVGKALARRLGRRFVDTDELVEQLAGMSVSRIFETRGEAYFRERESEVIAALEHHPPGSLVIATGGGAVLRKANMDSLERHGLIILLTASLRAINRRTGLDGGRPLLPGSACPQKALQLFREREPYYRRHYLKVDTTGKRPAQVAAEIMARLQRE